MIFSCKQCGKDFYHYPARRLKQGKAIYCSKACYSKAQTLPPGKKKTRREITRDYHNRKRFGGNKYKAFERDGYKCIVCFSDKNIEIHHIDGTGYKSIGDWHKSNNSLDNLMTLCHSCHANVTNGKLKLTVA